MAGAGRGAHALGWLKASGGVEGEYHHPVSARAGDFELDFGLAAGLFTNGHQSHLVCALGCSQLQDVQFQPMSTLQLASARRELRGAIAGGQLPW